MHNIGFTHVIVESDCWETISALYNHETGYSYFSSIISECQSLVNSFLSFKVSSVRRTANVTAHSLARAVFIEMNVPCTGGWMNTPPRCIEQFFD